MSKVRLFKLQGFQKPPLFSKEVFWVLFHQADSVQNEHNSIFSFLKIQKSKYPTTKNTFSYVIWLMGSNGFGVFKRTRSSTFRKKNVMAESIMQNWLRQFVVKTSLSSFSCVTGFVGNTAFGAVEAFRASFSEKRLWWLNQYCINRLRKFVLKTF